MFMCPQINVYVCKIYGLHEEVKAAIGISSFIPPSESQDRTQVHQA